MRVNLLVALISCQRLCSGLMGYDFAAPPLGDKSHCFCVDVVDRRDPPAMLWTARWAPTPKKQDPEKDDREERSYPSFLRDL